MSHYLERVAAMLTGELGGEKFKRPLILSGFLIALTSCGSATSRDIRAYSTCVARHPQEAALCEGPRQAYELDPAAFQARAAAIWPAGGQQFRRAFAWAPPCAQPRAAPSQPLQL